MVIFLKVLKLRTNKIFNFLILISYFHDHLAMQIIRRTHKY